MNYCQTEASFEGDAPAAAEEEALVDRRELALVAVERTRMPMVVTDPRKPDNPVVLANQAFLELTGYSAEEVIGRNCRFLQGEGTSEADIAALRRSLEDDDDHISIEMLNYRKDGSAFWNQLVISAVRSADGKLLYYFASQKDVTARRRAEELETAERLLLMEVDHRAINALALVQSVVRLSRADDVESYAASVLGRVDALARAHRLLADANWTGVDLADLIEMEVPGPYKPRVSLTGVAAWLPSRLVQPLSLLLHELVSNARKHGALARSDGTVAISWQTDGTWLRVSWREDGVGQRHSEPVAGLGLSLVKGIVEKQLAGKLASRWRPEGFEATLEFDHS